MSSEPVRLLDDPGAPAALRALLAAEPPAGPSTEQAAHLWEALAGGLPGPGGDGGEGGDGGPSGGDGGPSPAGSQAGPAGAPSAASASAAATATATAPASVSSVASATATVGAGAAWAGTPLFTWSVVAASAALSVGLAVVIADPAPHASSASPVIAAAPGERAPAQRVRPAEDRAMGDHAVPSPVAAPDVSARHAEPVGGSPSPVASARATPATLQGDALHAPAAAENAASDVAPSDTSAATSPESLAREEVAATKAARERLRGGDAAGALALLDAATVRFGSGVLGQERTALTVEALGGVGQRDRAAALARLFLARWPTSAHAARVAVWASPPGGAP